MTEQQAMRMALEALQFALHVGFNESSESQLKKGDKAGQQHREAIPALRQALEQQPAASHELLCVCGCTWEIKSDGSEELISSTKQPADELLRLRDLLGKANALARIRANEIKSLKASLYGLYELEKQRDELQERLIKTEGQLGEAVWNYGELKREQLANQQKTSGSPIDLLTEPAGEPVAIKWEKDADKECPYNNWVGITPFGRILITWKGWKDYDDACVDEFPGDFRSYGSPDEVKAACEAEYLRRLYTRPQPAAWVGLTDEEIQEIALELPMDAVRIAEAKLKEKNT